MPELETGAVVADKYRVVRRLGQGGFGAVYLVEHLHLEGQSYALKVLHSHLAADPQRRERFLREVKVAMQLVHPNIATIRDFAVSPALVYYTMDYVPGRTLERVIQEEKTLAPVRALALARQVVSALGAAHELGIVHRDMKPDNVILQASSGKEVVKVLDFGIAKVRAEAAAGLTGVGAIIGTPTYMAPEQARGTGQVDGRCDIYSLGAMLYHLIAGRPPFVSESPLGYIVQHQMDAPPAFAVAAPKIEAVPPDVEAIVRRALEKEPDARFQTAEEMVAAIDSVLGASRTPVPGGPSGFSLRDSQAGGAPAPGAAAGAAKKTATALSSVGGGGIDWSRKLAGQTVEKYRVVSPLGEGGFGAVCVAEHIHLGKRVALKLLRPELVGDEGFMERFRREARLACTLAHPAIVDIHDYGEVPGACYMVMELLTGETLETAIVRDGALGFERVLAFARPVLDALAFAHGRGVVHRDLKPANIMLLRTGAAKVLDFGIAKILDTGTAATSGPQVERDGKPLTQPGTVLGTAAYLSPEQARGLAVDGRSDLYALGLILYEALTGRRPFPAKDPRALMRAHVEQPAPRLAEAKPGRAFPAPLEAVVGRALAKRPEERFADAAAMWGALDAALAPVLAGASARTGLAGIATRLGALAARPGGGTAAGAGLERARVDVERPGSAPARRRFFIYATPSLPFGRSKPGKGESGGGGANVLVLRALPCRSQALDPECWTRTLEISSQHGELVPRADAIWLIDRSSRGTEVDGRPTPKGEPVRLPERCTLDLARGSLRLDVRVAPGAGGRPAWVRLERIDNAPQHAYLWVLGEARVGQDDEAALPVAPGAKRGGASLAERPGPDERSGPVTADGQTDDGDGADVVLANVDGRLAARFGDGREVPLEVGLDLRVPGVSPVSSFEPADTSILDQAG